MALNKLMAVFVVATKHAHARMAIDEAVKRLVVFGSRALAYRNLHAASNFSQSFIESKRLMIGRDASCCIALDLLPHQPWGVAIDRKVARFCLLNLIPDDGIIM